MKIERRICARCPDCGSPQYKKIPPAANVAFTKDRRCLDCKTTYTPPTPVWGSILLLVVGCFLAVACGLSILLQLRKGIVPSLPMEVGLGFIGLLCIRQAIASVNEKNIQPPDWNDNNRSQN